MNCLLLSAQNDEKLFIKGYTINTENLDVVQLANIRNIKSNERWISNRNGFFNISVHPNDTIKISAIGFQNMFIAVQNILPKNHVDTIIVLMKSISYQLKDVTIKSNFRRDSIARIVSKLLLHDSLLNNYNRIYLRPKGKIYLSKNPLYPGIIYEGPLTDLYNKFSKEGKDNISFEAFVKYCSMQQKVDDKYNKELIKSLTNIDDLELDEFILFCNLNRNFIYSANQYDLYTAIKKCGDEFNAKHLRDRMKLR